MIFYPISSYIDLLTEKGLLTESHISDKTKVVKGFSFDSRNVPEESLFIAKGLHFEKQYLDTALASGAMFYVAQARIGDSEDYILVNDIRMAMAVLARFFYNDPQQHLKNFGLTGTKGKTSTSTFLHAILDLDAEKRGVPLTGISDSIDIWDGLGISKPINTTPEAPDIWKYYAHGVEAGLERFVLEISSQAIKYLRVEGMKFDVACITNIGYDHIGPAEHPTLEDYVATKISLYDRCKFACINIDDEHAPEMLERAKDKTIITFGEAEGAMLRLSDVRKESDGTHFTITTPESGLEFRLSMPGLFNARNALAATAMAYADGVPLETCRDAVSDVMVKGRMEATVSKDGLVTVIVDYAHNALSFSTLFDSIEKEYEGYDIINVYGWHGSKAENRRKDIGVITGKRAILTVITEKDSADEPYDKIAGEAAYWISSVGGKYEIVRDRELALRFAVDYDNGGRKKVILFTGRGEEDWQKLGGKYYPYPADPDTAVKVVADYDRKHPVK